MKIKIRSIIYHALVLLVLVIVFMIALDWFRAPAYPENFIQQQFTTINGDKLAFTDKSQEKPLLIYIWATWCSICQTTTPTVSDLYDDGYNIVSVALRSGDDNRMLKYLVRKNIKMPVINDFNGSLTSSLNINVTPMFIIVDKGRVVYSTVGWTSQWGMRLRLWIAQLIR